MTDFPSAEEPVVPRDGVLIPLDNTESYLHSISAQHRERGEEEPWRRRHVPPAASTSLLAACSTALPVPCRRDTHALVRTCMTMRHGLSSTYSDSTLLIIH